MTRAKESPKYEQIEEPGGAMDQAELLHLYRTMVVIRLLEEKSAELYQQGKIGGFLHLYIGQEATGVGAISARRPDDNVITAYRDHGIAVACGMEPRVILAEMLGKITGSSKGKGGSMHLADINLKFWGGHAIVGAHIALATGIALADKYRGSDAVTLCFFGDGATNIGYFHEALNLAAVWALPVVFICENNQYGMGTSVERASAVPEMRQKAEAYAMPNARVDGMELLAVREATQKAIDHARAGNGPYFLESLTYRFRGHSMGDPERYRKPDEIRKWQTDDPIGRFEKVLKEQGVPQDAISTQEREAEQTIAEAVKFAEESPLPPAEELWTDIYEDPETARMV
jgi:pyruvate dehydrogenase E1 component alpha subunit